MKKNFDSNIFKKILNFFKEKFESFVKNCKNFNENYPKESRTIQLNFIYFFGLVDLSYNYINNIFSLGLFNESASSSFDFIVSFLSSPFFQIWASPEKVFFISYVTLEILIIRPIILLPKFIRYNIILVFAILMLQGLIMSFGDLIFNREIISKALTRLLDEEVEGFALNKLIGTFYFSITFLIFLIEYYKLYVNSLKGKMVTIRGFYWITDSIAFWLRIKTPTMRKFDGKEKDADNS
jgi:hypothetical protein